MCLDQQDGARTDLLLTEIVRQVGDHDLVLAWDAVFRWAALLAWLLHLALASLVIETFLSWCSGKSLIRCGGEGSDLAWDVGWAVVTVGGGLLGLAILLCVSQRTS